MIMEKKIIGNVLPEEFVAPIVENLIPILNYLKGAPTLTEDQIFEYGRFLLMKVIFQDTKQSVYFSPPEKIAQVWHVHMLHSNYYASSCQLLCGHVIEYNYFDITAQRRTLDTYRSCFGERPPSAIWTPKYQVTIVCLTGHSFVIDNLESLSTILMVKQAIKNILGIPVQNQQLFYTCNMLNNKRTLFEYHIKTDDVLYLVLQHTIF